MKKILSLRNTMAWLARERWQGSAVEPLMSKVNQLPQLLRPLAASDVLIRGMYLMNDLPMHETYGWVKKFDALAVAQATPMVIGKPVQVNHATEGHDGLPIGRFFDAEVEVRPDGTTWMSALFFMLNDEQGMRIANSIDSGIIAENSPTIEFDRVYCSVCGADDLNCDHVPGQIYDGKKCYVVMTDVSDVLEGSLAWSGRQRNTGFYAAASRDPKDLIEVDEHLVQLAKKKGDLELVTPWQNWWGLPDGLGG